MATIKEMADFCSKLPEDTRAVLVVQRGQQPQALRTEELDLVVGEPWPNWPRAVWHGICGGDDGDGFPPTIGTA